NVALSIPSLPPGVTASFTPGSTSGNNSTLTVNVGPNAALGNHNLVVLGTSGNLTNTATLQLAVKGFSLSLSAPHVHLTGGDPELRSGDVTVTINRSPGVNDSVQLSVEGLPVGAPQGGAVTATLNPTSTTGATSTLHLTAGRFAPEASLVLTVRGTSGALVD